MNGLQLNTIDFELFKIIVQHEKLQLNIASQLMDLVCDIARRNILFTRVCLHLSLMLLQRYGAELIPVVQDIIKKQLESIVE